MTKAAKPFTFSKAIARVAGHIGHDEAAKLVRRSARLVYLWGDADSPKCPTLDQALALDAAYAAAGGQGAPILEAYALQLGTIKDEDMACRRELAAAIAEASREVGDAIAAGIALTMPGSTSAQFYAAMTETEQAHSAVSRLARRIKSFLPTGGRGTGGPQ